MHLSGAVEHMGDNLTVSGLWVRELIRGNDPETIPVPAASVEKGNIERIRSWINASLGTSGLMGVALWTRFAGAAAGILMGGALLLVLYGRSRRNRRLTYGDIVGPAASRTKTAKQKRKKKSKKEAEWTKEESILAKPILILSLYFTLIYLGWRVVCSIPVKAGALAVIANLVLLVVEVLGFVESLVLYHGFLGLRDYPLPHIPIDAWPEVDVFIATYNEPLELLRRTINGCKHMRYPDPGKVHIWLCDDNRRPHMLLPILKESMGISASVFAVTDKSGVGGKRKLNLRAMCPYLILSALSVAAIFRIILIFEVMQTVNLLILLFWIGRNLYYLIMAIFMIDGRDSDNEPVKVNGSELVTLQLGETIYKGVTTQMTEHNLEIFLSDGQELAIGDHVTVSILCIYEDVVLQGIVTGIQKTRNKSEKTYVIEILNYGEDDSEYLQLLYDRVPSLPQSLEWDFGSLSHLWQNIACRVALTRK